MVEAEKPQPDAPKPNKCKRRWFQFSLRSLLVATVICAIACGWLGKKIEQKRNERNAVEALMKVGGYVRYDYENVKGAKATGPGWLRQLLGENFFSNAVRVQFIGRSDVVAGTGGDVTDDDLAHLKTLPQLKELGLVLTPRITDAGLEHLKGLAELNLIHLGQTGVTDTGLANLKGLTQLEHFFLEANNISDAGLANMQGLIQLRELSIGEDRLTDDGLINLEHLTNLRYLSIRGNNFTDAGLEHLKKLTGLYTLEIDSQRITDAGLLHLKSLTELQTLLLNGTHVSDAGLELLTGLSQLRTLDVDATEVTDAGVASLQSALPNCQISYWHQNAPFRPNAEASTPGRKN